MSTKSGPYELTIEGAGVWSYQHDMDMWKNFPDNEGFYVWGPGIYLELPMNPNVRFNQRAFLVGIPTEVLSWLDRWPEAPETLP